MNKGWEDERRKQELFEKVNIYIAYKSVEWLSVVYSIQVRDFDRNYDGMADLGVTINLQSEERVLLDDLFDMNGLMTWMYACGNAKYQPVYSETAPPPAEEEKDNSGVIRQKCIPILLREWGYGDNDDRYTLLIRNDGGSNEYAKDPVNDKQERSGFKTHIKELNEGKNEEDIKELIEEYDQALMTCDNLLCLYGGVITIEENSEPGEETITEEDLEPEEEMLVVPDEDEMAEGMDVRACSENLRIFLKSYETGGIRPTVADKLIILPDGRPATRMYYDSENYPTIGWGHKIEGSGTYRFSDGTTKNLYQDEISLGEADEMFQTDVAIKQTNLNRLLDPLDLSVTQREYDMLLSLTFNTGTGALTNDQKYPQTKRWFETQGYKDKEYSKFVLGDIINGGDDGLKARRLDELEILLNNSYRRDEGDLDRILSEDGESIWLRSDKINELAEIWKSSPDYKGDRSIDKNQ